MPIPKLPPGDAVLEFHEAPPSTASPHDSTLSKDSKKSPLKAVHGEAHGLAGAGANLEGGKAGGHSKDGRPPGLSKPITPQLHLRISPCTYRPYPRPPATTDWPRPHAVRLFPVHGPRTCPNYICSRRLRVYFQRHPGRAVEYCVALPPGYDASPDKYPALYYLHGLFEHDRSWRDQGQQTWESLMNEGKIGKFIVVMPEGGKSFYVNSLDGHERYEDFFIQESCRRSTTSFGPSPRARPAESAAFPWEAMVRCTWACTSGHFRFRQRPQRRADCEVPQSPSHRGPLGILRQGFAGTLRLAA